MQGASQRREFLQFSGESTKRLPNDMIDLSKYEDCRPLIEEKLEQATPTCSVNGEISVAASKTEDVQNFMSFESTSSTAVRLPVLTMPPMLAV